MTADIQLLQCLRTTLTQVGESDAPSVQEALLGAADLVLNELIHRQDRDFYLDHYQSGCELAKEGLNLLGNDNANLSVSLPAQLPVDVSSEKIKQQSELLFKYLVEIVDRLPTSGEEQTADYLERMTDWEVNLYARQVATAPQPAQEVMENVVITRDRFEAYLKNKFPEWTNLSITSFTPISGGFSKSTILVDTQDDVNGEQSLVIRALQGTHIIEHDAGNIINEYPVVKLAFDCGSPVAEPLWLEDDEKVFGVHFFVSRRAKGEILGTAAGATAPLTDAIVEDLISVLAKLHNINLADHQKVVDNTILDKWYSLGSMQENTREWIKYWRTQAEECGAVNSPLIERGLRWLEDNIEECMEKPVLVHGDYGLHNILIENEKVEALLDWEGTRAGDPAEELSWLLACLGGYLDANKALKLYEKKADNRKISEFRLRYFQVFDCIKMPIVCIASLKAFENQLDNIQFAILGLRFMHHNSRQLNEAIRLAEKAKDIGL
ncbi:MAG: phosphotransferase family protein [Halieaceae bacterium]|nr:phosphotransferase family protein [Halieaceae bacterium]